MERTVQETVGLFKLTTGEEIVSEYIEGEETFTLTSPRLVIPRRSADGKGVDVGLAPWFFAAPDDSFVMSRTVFLAWTDNVEKGLRDGYLQNVSGLQIAQNLAGLKL